MPGRRTEHESSTPAGKGDWCQRCTDRRPILRLRLESPALKYVCVYGESVAKTIKLVGAHSARVRGLNKCHAQHAATLTSEFQSARSACAKNRHRLSAMCARSSSWPDPRDRSRCRHGSGTRHSIHSPAADRREGGSMVRLFFMRASAPISRSSVASSSPLVTSRYN